MAVLVTRPDVLVVSKRSQKRLVAAKMREQSQLDLRVVKTYEAKAAFGLKAASHIFCQRAASGDILQVRIFRREPARAGSRLDKVRVYPAVSVFFG